MTRADINLDDRPRPLRDLAARWSKTMTVIIGVVASLSAAGIFSADQATGAANALTALDVVFAAILGLITAAGTAAGAWRVAQDGEPQVTPLTSPMDNDGRPLVPTVARDTGSPTPPLTNPRRDDVPPSGPQYA